MSESEREVEGTNTPLQSLEGPPSPALESHGLPPEVEGDAAVADMEAIISIALRYGVLLSFFIVLLGSIWFFLAGRAGYADLSTTGRHAVSSLTAFHSGNKGAVHSPTTPGDVITGLRQGKPYALIALGLLLLIATPVFRVAVSVFTFLWERDRLYAAITAYVLTVLIVSFLIGKGG
jgi:uncharacterized membrane protein